MPVSDALAAGLRACLSTRRTAMSLNASPRDIVRLFWAASNARDWPALRALLHDDITYTVPQTRERLVGADAFVRFFEQWPQPWRCEVVQLLADGDEVVSRIDFISPEPPMTGISFFRLRGGRVAQIQEYWPQDYEPPERTVPDLVRMPLDEAARARQGRVLVAETGQSSLPLAAG